MTLHLYAVTLVDAAPPEGLHAHRATRLSVMYADQEDRPKPTRDAVLAFGRTIETLAAKAPVLPIRFGTSVADLDELRQLVREQEAGWAARLEAVAGCCELIVHLDRSVACDPRPQRKDLTGREYLLRLADGVHSREGVRTEMCEMLRPILRDFRCLPGTDRHDRVAVLVPRAVVTTARTDLQRWAAGRDDLEVAITGPWPPFSFCEAVA